MPHQRPPCKRLLLFVLLIRRTRARRAYKQPLAVGECDLPTVGSVRPVFGLIALDDNLGPERDGLLRPATSDHTPVSGRARIFPPPPPDHRPRWARLDHPAFHLAVCRLDVDVDPRVRIDPLH